MQVLSDMSDLNSVGYWNCSAHQMKKSGCIVVAAFLSTLVIGSRFITDQFRSYIDRPNLLKIDQLNKEFFLNSCTQFFNQTKEEIHALPDDGYLDKQNSAIMLYTSEGHKHTVHTHFNDGQLAPLTRWAQAEIYKNQFVPDCNEAQIMVTHGYESGFGSEMHVIGAMLAYAIEYNHTLVLAPSACRAFVDYNNCLQGCACLFQPISNCEYHQVVNSDSTRHPTTISQDSIKFGFSTRAENKAKMSTGPFNIQHTIPTRFRAALINKIPSMSQHELKYWWRAQSVAFLMRFNNATVEAVSSLRKTQSMHYFSSSRKTTILPYPLPANSVAIHIRGGDKWSEMTLVPAIKYIDAVLTNIRNAPLSFADRVVFTSSDDADALEAARMYAEQENLSFAYSRMYRENGGHSLATWQREDNSVKKDRFYFHLLQLVMSLEADSWIGTRASNWNRLIDELRCVWVDKCNGMYTEVGDSYAEYNY